MNSLLTLTKKSVLRIRDAYLGSELVHPGFEFFHLEYQIQIFPSRIPDPNFSSPDPGQQGTESLIRIFSIPNPNPEVKKTRVVDPYSFFTDPDPDPDPEL
jgi:hypothetical protein